MKSRHKPNLIRLTLINLLFSISIFSCKKFIELPPPATSLSETNVYSTDATAAAVLTGIYAQISEGNNSLSIDGNFTSPSFGLSLSADELTLYDINNVALSYYYTNSLDPINHPSAYWGTYYSLIFDANSAVEGLTTSTGLTPEVQQQLLGEAEFVRAFCYFYLVTLFGDVPLATTTNYKVNAALSRAPASQIYQQIVADLLSAKNLLSIDYLQSDALTAYTSSPQRVRPTKWAAEALLAKVYLYTQDYQDAEAMADSVISNTALFSLDSLDSVFLMNSTETIWSLRPVNNYPTANTGEGALFDLPSTGPNTSGNYPVYLSNNLLNSFEPGDQRRVGGNWVDSVIVGNTTYYFPYKYKQGAGNTSVQEYIMVLRLGEQYLIRSEAEAELGQTGPAAADLNTIRQRASLGITSANTKSTLLTAILHERQIELFTEWGNRWLDLQRFGTINLVMNVVAPQKGGSWSSYKALYPIPESEIKLDPNLVQNPGY